MNTSSAVQTTDSALVEATRTVDAEYSRIAGSELAKLRTRYVRATASRPINDGAEAYSQAVSRHRVMPYPVQARLVEMDQDTRLHPALRKEARELLVMSNQRIVISVAYGFSGRGVAHEALIQAGNEGMLEAVDQFNPTKGANFVTYAKQKIQMRMRRTCENASAAIHGARLPVDFYNFVYATVRRAVQEIEAETNVTPSTEEIHARIVKDTIMENEELEESKQKKIPTIDMVTEAYSWLAGRRPISMQLTVGDQEGDTEFGTLLDAGTSVEFEVSELEMSDSVMEAFELLDEDEHKLFGSLVGYRDYPHLQTAVKVADYYGVSIAETRRTVNRARGIVQNFLTERGYNPLATEEV